MQNNTKFNCIFHHGGEFVREETIFYRVGVQTIVTDFVLDAWKVGVIRQLVCSWGYQDHEIRVWCKMDRIVNEFVQVDQDSIAIEVAMYAIGEGMMDKFMLSIMLLICLSRLICLTLWI